MEFNMYSIRWFVTISFLLIFSSPAVSGLFDLFLPEEKIPEPLKDYEVCADNRRQAFLDLAAEMSVTILNESTENVKLVDTNFWSSLNRTTEMKQSVTSNAEIMGANVFNKNGQYCVSLSGKNLTLSAKKHLDDVMTLSKAIGRDSNFKGRYKLAEEIIVKARMSSSLAQIAVNNKIIKLGSFKKYKNAVNSAVTLSNMGGIRFNGDKSSQLYFNGQSFVYGSSKDVAPGRYSYKASFRNGCDQTGTITIKKAGEKVVRLKKVKRPTVTFTSPDVNERNVSILMDGKSVSISKVITLGQELLNSSCKGTVSWQAQYRAQSDSGTISAKGGDEHTITLDFLSQNTIKNIQSLASTWRKGTMYELYSSRWMPEHDNYIGEDFTSVQASWLKIKGPVIHGPVVDFANFAGTNSYHAGYHARLQLTQSSADSMPFHLFKLPVTPFVYAQASMGYMSYKADSGGREKTDQPGWKNYLMTSFGVGSFLLISNDYSVSVKAQKNYHLDSGFTVFLGAALRLD